jgi:hypothetical protein
MDGHGKARAENPRASTLLSLFSSYVAWSQYIHRNNEPRKQTMTQDHKHDYLRCLYALLQRQAPEHGMTDEPMVGTLYCVEDEDSEYTYINVGVAQYLGGEDFPENNDIRLQSERVSANGELLAQTDEPFILTFNLAQDAQHYFERVQAHRQA